MKQTLYLIAGANGSGKTTLAHELLHDEKITFLNPDEIAAEINDRVGLAAGKILLKRLDEIFKAKKSFAMESTISGQHHLRVLERAGKAGYEIVLIYVFLDNVALNIARVQKRVKLGGHNVPEADIRRRWTKSVCNFSRTAGLADRWKLYYNGHDNYELVAEKGRATVSGTKFHSVV